jgi:hypothetical protein
MGRILETGHRVVERSHVEKIFDEQRFRLVHTAEQEADVLRLGAMAGATQVIFVQAESFLNKRQSVNLRSVDAESGTIRWAGTAALETDGVYVIENAEQSLVSLAELALRRAFCPTEKGWQWKEPSADMPGGGCVNRPQ